MIIAGEPNPSPPLQHVEEQLFFVRGGFFTCAASRSKFSNIQRRSAAPSRRLWAGPFCSSRRPSRSASHESGREGWKRDGRVGRLAAHGATRRGGVSAACARAFTAFWLPCVFCVLLRVRAFVLQAAWRGVAVVCLVWVFASFGCKAGHLTRAARVKSGNSGQIRNHGFFLLCILMTLIFSDQLSPTRAKRSFPVWPSFAAKWSSGIGVCSRISLHRDSRTV